MFDWRCQKGYHVHRGALTIGECCRYGPRENVARAVDLYADIARSTATGARGHASASGDRAAGSESALESAPRDAGCGDTAPGATPPAASAAAGPAASSWHAASETGDETSVGGAGSTAPERASGDAAGSGRQQPGLARLSVKWALGRSCVAGLVVGARTPQQLAEVVAAAADGGALGEEVLRAVDAVHERFPNPCP